MSQLVTLKRTCRICKKDSSITVDQKHVKAWQAGAMAQTAFPELTPNQREQVISGVHGPCFDSALPPEEVKDESPAEPA